MLSREHWLSVVAILGPNMIALVSALWYLEGLIAGSDTRNDLNGQAIVQLVSEQRDTITQLRGLGITLTDLRIEVARLQKKDHKYLDTPGQDGLDRDTLDWRAATLRAGLYAPDYDNQVKVGPQRLGQSSGGSCVTRRR